MPAAPSDTANDCLIVCQCAVSRSLPPEPLEQVLGFLEAVADQHRETRVFRVADLCGLAAGQPIEGEDNIGLRSILDSARRAVIVACEPRAVRWLLSWAGIPLPEETRFVNLRKDNALAQLQSANDGGHRPPEGSTGCLAQATPRKDHATGEVTDGASGTIPWVPWFPVIDRDACVGCGKCLDFCLFGVYAEQNDGHIVVQNPRKCKNNCPACARICPVNAVIFPKFGKAPINGGEPTATPPHTDANGINPVIEAKRSRRRKLFNDDFEAEL